MAFIVDDVNLIIMLPLVHFILSIGIAFCLEYRHPSRFTAILSLGFIGMLPDLDHFLPLWNGVGLFHNTLVLGVFPLAFIMISSIMEIRKNTNSSKYQRFFVCVAVVLMAHLLVDLATGSGIYIGFPTSTEAFSIGATPLLKYSGTGVLVMASDMVWLGMMVLVVSGNFIQKKIYATFEDYSVMGETPSILSTVRARVLQIVKTKLA